MRFFVIICIALLLASCRTRVEHTARNTDRRLLAHRLELLQRTDHDVCIPYEQRPVPKNYTAILSQLPYPEKALQDSVEGIVYFDVLFDSTGVYVKHVEYFSGSHVLSQAIEPHLAKLRVEPGVINGHPIAGWLPVPVRFELSPTLDQSISPKALKRLNEINKK